MFDEEQLRRMTPQERHELMSALARLDSAVLPPERAGEPRRKLALLLIVVCCVVLAAWIGVLAMTLPKFYRTGGWRGAWIGFDVALLAAFAVTGWASWRRRQVLIICLIVLATLLCCDAWFDVALDFRTPGFYLSLASALVVELPVAGVAILGARRLLRMTSLALARSQGYPDGLLRLRDMRLVGTAAGRPLHDLLVTRPGGRREQAAGPAAGQAGPPAP